MEIGFNSRFLLDMLTNLDTPEVRLAMSLPNKAGLLMPNMPDNKDEDVLMLVMPVMINR
jgi:DNA polymerase-3 subunit beta